MVHGYYGVMKNKMIFKQFGIYSLIGILNTLIHVVVFGLLLANDVSATWANGMAFFSTATFSYWANAKWTFQQSYQNLSSYMAFVAWMGSLAIFSGWLVDYLAWTSWLAIPFFMVLSVILGFLGAKKLVFRKGNSS
ncbi:Putative flippase GtrA (transmembrane translocase of bactoprenol-linked glucose) [Alysiella filiformis DSM 16848]|uniref:Flippase GtrA (Transmembrane translocase of bactoprenol-linked glucose) n=3 Tax=Pseudomonadota TaxID=1224 RepID=A0A286EIF7_9NEIS|nr:Putative flippase GtrA (transmembrane translocase of bactoprenol-linked glucose) [Alysiella filiformis DSM 16848]